MQTTVGVEKLRDRNVFWAAIIGEVDLFLSPQLSGGVYSRWCRLAEEPHQALNILGHGCQEELLSHELQSPQAQAAQPDLILQFREQRFHLLSLPLCLGKLGRVRQVACALPGRLILSC